jgi:hypothetical protein
VVEGRWPTLYGASKERENRGLLNDENATRIKKMANFNGINSVNMTTTLQALSDQLSIHTRLQKFWNVGNIDGQPMLRLASNVNQMLLTRRMPWKWNRVNLGSNNPAVNPAFFVTQMGFQDFHHAGASCFALINSTTPGGQLPAGGAGVDLNPGTYQNGTAQIQYGTFNGGNSYGPTGNWQTAGIIFNPASGTFTVQFLDPHPFQTGNIGTSQILIAGVVNPAYNSTFTYNQLACTSQWINSYTLLSIPDNFHIVLQGTSGQHGSIGSISASGGVTTVSVSQTMTPGDIMTFTGITTNSALNGKTVTLLTTSANSVTFTTPTGVTITNGSDTGTMYAAPSGAPGIWNLGWVESAAVVDINNPSFPLPVNPIDAVHRIAPEYTSTGDTLSLSCEIDYGNGVVKFRISEPVSTYPFAFNVVYQAKAPKFTSGSSIFQWPDDLSWVLFEMLLWQGMRFAYGATAQETQAQAQAAQIAVMAALASEDREDSIQAITPNYTLMGGAF